MWRDNLKKIQPAYIYLLLVAVGFVLIFSWGQLSFFNWRELSAPAQPRIIAQEEKQFYSEKIYHLLNTAQENAKKQYDNPEKPHNIFDALKNIFRARKYRAQLKRLEKIEAALSDPESRAQANFLLAQYYDTVEKDAEKAQFYYLQAMRLGGGKSFAGQARAESENTVRALQTYSYRSLLEIGQFYKTQEKYSKAQKAFEQIISDYQNQPRSSKQGRSSVFAALQAIVALDKPQEPFFPYRSLNGDPLKELQQVMNLVVSSIVRNRPKEIIPLIPAEGVESSREPGRNYGEEERYSQKMILYQLKKKRGPHYEGLYGQYRKKRISLKEVTYWIEDVAPNVYKVQLLLGDQGYQKLYFQVVEDTWQLTFIGLD